ncbi:hypothetical protein [Paenibacillus illinoisensis]|uniref:hypothetical protein n=1 Tax=Paenibacillus illinoisensis TaxID=59845 RepID=UPI00203CBE4D|nr:hypothetical protein [Paenibacillus illinoisensis]
MTRSKDSTFIPMYSVKTDRALLSQKYVLIATGSGRDGIDSEEAIAVAFVSEFQTFKKINQENLETTAIGRTIRICNGHVPTRYFLSSELMDSQ